jgi:hypothetical protein
MTSKMRIQGGPGVAVVSNESEHKLTVQVESNRACYVVSSSSE